ncbi:MAG: hypothetical protein ABJA79_00795 [Parafilimonas sp.]
MERELILAVKQNTYDRGKVETEIENIKKTFPYTESFEAFKTCNEVFDMNHHKHVTGIFRLKNIFHEGFGKNSECCILCLN